MKAGSTVWAAVFDIKSGIGIYHYGRERESDSLRQITTVELPARPLSRIPFILWPESFKDEIMLGNVLIAFS